MLSYQKLNNTVEISTAKKEPSEVTAKDTLVTITLDDNDSTKLETSFFVNVTECEVTKFALDISSVKERIIYEIFEEAIYEFKSFIIEP